MTDDDTVDGGDPVPLGTWRQHDRHGQDRLDVVEHNLRVLIDRLDAQSDVLDAVVTALRNIEQRQKLIEHRLSIVERATPFRAPPKPPPPRR